MGTTIKVSGAMDGQNWMQFFTRDQTGTILTLEITGYLLTRMTDKFSM